ncbi:MAG: methyl-accepting chemotaxis protein [Noviherbaspirillum sp.]
MKISNLKIGTRLGLGFALVLAFMALITVVGIVRLQQVAGATSQMNEASEKMLLVEEWMGGTMANSVRAHAIALSNDPAQEKYYQTAMDSQAVRLEQIQKRMAATVTSEEGKRMMALAAQKRQLYEGIRKKIMDFKSSGREMGAGDLKKQIDNDLQEANAAYLNAMQQFVAQQKTAFGVQHAAVQSLTQSSRTLMLGVGIVAIALGAILAWLLSRSITIPLAHAVTVARTVAAGNLASRIESGSSDETGQLLLALRDMNQSLQKSVAEVRSGTDTIATASRQIAAGNMELSSRTEEQASALEETASSMQELTSTVKQNADHAHQAKLLATSASDVAATGGAVMTQVVQTMAAINESSRKVFDIISVIDGIAFQTNILALNAAVEAARAGEQGRGFAVVASEVRSLAQRSASAAKDIKTLIDASVNRVNDGSALVSEAGATMEQIVDRIKRVTDIMADIAAATSEQSVGIEQVNQAVGQMDKVTQQNAALVEEAAAAAQSLQDQAVSLAQAVSFFQLHGSQHTVTAPASASPALLPRQPHARAMAGPGAARKLAAQVPARAAPAARSAENWSEF